jgi:hypothetical protein
MFGAAAGDTSTGAGDTAILIPGLEPVAAATASPPKARSPEAVAAGSPPVSAAAGPPKPPGLNLGIYDEGWVGGHDAPSPPAGAGVGLGGGPAGGAAGGVVGGPVGGVDAGAGVDGGAGGAGVDGAAAPRAPAPEPELAFIITGIDNT